MNEQELKTAEKEAYRQWLDAGKAYRAAKIVLGGAISFDKPLEQIKPLLDPYAAAQEMLTLRLSVWQEAHEKLVALNPSKEQTEYFYYG